MPTWRIERLAASHDRGSFCCGKPPLDDFIQKSATQYERRNLGRTYVAVQDAGLQVLGYHTLASGSVAFADLLQEVSRKLPRHPIPVVHLGRLAVDQQARGQRLGETLLLDALHRSYTLSEQTGIFAVEVIALDEEARRFYLKYDFTPLLDDSLHRYLTIKKIRQLFGK